MALGWAFLSVVAGCGL